MNLQMLSQKKSWRQSKFDVFFLINITYIAIFYFSFNYNDACLYWGMDGNIWTVQKSIQLQNRELFKQAGASPFDGSFDTYFPIYVEYLVSDWARRILSLDNASNSIYYTIHSAFLMLSTQFLGRSLRFDWATCYLASFVLPTAMLPVVYGEASYFYALFSIVPDHSQLIGFAMITVGCIWSLGHSSGLYRVFLLFVPTVCVLISILSAPTFVVLPALAIIVYCSAAMFDFRKNSGFKYRWMSVLLIVAALAFSGSAIYIYTIYKYNAYSYFSSEMKQPREELIYASTYWYQSAGKFAIVLSIAGSTLAIYRRNYYIPFALSVTHSVFLPLFVMLSSVMVVYYSENMSVSPVYFESGIWPFIVLFASFFITQSVRYLFRQFTIKHLQDSANFTIMFKFRLYSISTVIPLFVTLNNIGGYLISNSTNCRGFSPINSTDITDYIAQSISIFPGQRFRGFATTITGVESSESVSWMSLHQFDYNTWSNTGNDHRMLGLWKFRIPTLMQYSSTISPQYYGVLTHFLARKNDVQVRGVLTLTHPNLKMMQLWGVKHVITDNEEFSEKSSVRIRVKDNTNLYVIDLPDPNLGNYSPVVKLPANDFRSGLRIMESKNFDPRRDVVMFDNNEIDSRRLELRSGNLEYLNYTSRGFSVKAKSEGDSIIILPVQYSHCWKIANISDARIVRANLLQLGILFSHELEASIEFKYGPLWASACRLRDIDDMNRFDVRSVRGD
ncbi:hypothetical protein [Bosea sp. R86505]|uniref:hypothetical protein n=1 Tax=Bosea sp. R86505 TaxID=3101710 RepID=UPI00366C877D